jgi:hypothetical protein
LNTHLCDFIHAILYYAEHPCSGCNFLALLRFFECHLIVKDSWRLGEIRETPRLSCGASL